MRSHSYDVTSTTTTQIGATVDWPRYAMSTAACTIKLSTSGTLYVPANVLVPLYGRQVGIESITGGASGGTLYIVASRE